METIIQIISSLLDMFILKTYLTKISGRINERISIAWFYSAIIAAEIILQANTVILVDSSSRMSMLITNLISLTTTFLLCFFLATSILQKIIFSAVFQIAVLLSENICIIISSLLYDGTLTGYEYDISMNLMSKIILLIFTVLLSLIGKNGQKHPKVYSVLMLFTPILSLCLLVLMPLNHDYIISNISFFSIIWVYIAVINIVHTTLVEKLADSYASRMYASALEKQLVYQKEKYTQLGESYKTGRRIIHDIKHHNEVLKSYISRGNYEEMYGYLTSYSDALEKTYIKINTGNLVIDSLVTNYSDIAASSNIRFIYSLEVDNARIPLPDYELSIVLGNLLDNSLHACEHLASGNAFIKVNIVSDRTDRFIILVENTYSQKDRHSRHISIDHGYGLDNVKQFVEAHHGLMKIDSADTFKTTVIIPITDRKQRYTPAVF